MFAVHDGHARFEVLTPSLVRMEYAADGRFQDGRTMTAVHRPSAPATVRRSGTRLTIRTKRLTLRYAGGALSSVRVTFDGRTITPTPGAHHVLGGWTRALDLQTGPVPLNPGILSRDGWDVVDDTKTALLTHGSPGFAVRPAHTGDYQDWYLFAYGDDYPRALRDLRTLTGPAPLLPRSAFGVWFSRYYPYSAAELMQLRADFRAHHVPLDTLSVDTDYKRVNNAAGAAIEAAAVGTPGKPASWNGWDWNRDLFPNPQGFLDWAHGQGLSIALNIHPSIDSTDPRYPSGVTLTADSDCRILQADPLGTCMSFDWTDPKQLDAYFALHKPFAGADVLWLDWCCEGAHSAVAPGLSPDTWINSRYAAYQRSRGQRWPAFARMGGGYASDGVDGDRTVGAGGTGALAEHRYTIQFTGDTCATWAMLAFEAQLTAAEGASIGLPYVSHDIGSFNGQPQADGCNGVTAPTNDVVDPDLYARWVQFATFQPLDRLHSNHGKRLPWEYTGAAAASATRSLRLREALVPYTYTLARRAHDTGLPLAGALYLRWPRQVAAYDHPAEFTFGRDVVVAPVTAAGDPAKATYWVPPGRWTDFFTGARLRGPALRTESVPLSRMPVLVRAGAIIPTQPVGDHTRAAPARRLVLTAYPGNGGGSLYEDAGTGFGYEHGHFTRTRFTQRRTRRAIRIRIIGPRRRWSVHALGANHRPVVVTACASRPCG